MTVRATLDPAAVQAVEAGGGKLEDRVRLGDLAAAGWTVSSWTRAGDGSAAMTLSKPFSRPDEVAGILHEINGDSGPIRDVRVTRDHGLLSTRFETTGTLDLSSLQTGISADPQLVAGLTNQHVDVSALDQALSTQLGQSLSVRVVVRTPSGITTIKGVPGQKVPIDTTSNALDARRVGFLVVALVLLLAAFVVLATGRRRRQRRA